MKEGLSVRKVEELAKSMQNETDEPKPENNNQASRDFDLLKHHLSARFGTQVHFTCDPRGKGKITFPFANEDELERLITIFDNINQS